MKLRRLLAFGALAALVGALLQRTRLMAFVLPRVSDNGWRIPGLSYAMSKSWARKHQALRACDLPTGSVVMLGDSITEFADWGLLLPHVSVHNHGIGGDDTTGVLRRLDLVTRAQPSQVFLMIGTNDLSKGDLSEAAIVDKVDEIVVRIQTESPSTSIYVQSVLPRWTTRRASIEQLNVGLESMAAARSVEWLDLRPLFDRGDGSMDLSLAPDALHPNREGYRRWAAVLEPLIVRAERNQPGGGSGT